MPDSRDQDNFNRRGNWGALLTQVAQNMNPHSIRDVLTNNKLPYVAETFRTRLFGYSKMDLAAAGEAQYYGAELLGHLRTYDIGFLIPRLALNYMTQNIPAYIDAAKLFGNFGVSGSAKSKFIICGPTSNTDYMLNNGLEVIDGESEYIIDQHKGGLMITPDGQINVFLPDEKDYLYQQAFEGSVLLGTPLAFEVPDNDVDLVDMARYVICEQGYTTSPAIQKGFLAITPEGDIRYHVFSARSHYGTFDYYEDVGVGVLAMLITETPGTRICSLEEAKYAKPTPIRNFPEQYCPMYFYAG